MKHRILLLLCSFALSISAQINQTDAAGKKQGVWEKTYEGTMQLRYRGQFVDDVPVGEFTYWHGNGNRKSVITYRGNTGVGFATLYDPDGWRMAEGLFDNSEKDSVWNYYDSGGNLVSTETWVDGKLHGAQKVFYPDGKIAEITHYEHGLREGLWMQKFADGTMRARGSYVNNELHGNVMYFNQTGSPDWSGEYVHGVKEGKWYTYRDGKAVHVEVYFEGELVEEKDL